MLYASIKKSCMPLISIKNATWNYEIWQLQAQKVKKSHP
jgi:hypothetical protein